MNPVPFQIGLILRYIFLLSFLLVLNLFFLPISIHAQTPNLVNITLNPTSLDHNMKINDTVTVGVDIDPGNSYKVTGIELKIFYNPEVLELFNTIPGDYLTLPSAAQCPNCQPVIANSSYTATFVSGTGANPKTEPGRLLQLQFKAIKNGETRVVVSSTSTNISGYDAQNNPVDTNLLGTINNATYIISDSISDSCSAEGSPCGIGLAGPKHPLGTCCNGLSCISSNSPDAGGTCQKCYQLPECVYDNPPCSITVPSGVEICSENPPKCVNPPPCLNGIKQPDGNIIYCDPQPGIVYCPITPLPPPIDCPTHQFGDANCDGIINDRDYRIWEFEMQFSELPYKRADFNSVGREDMVDFEIWRRNYQGPDICTTNNNSSSMTY